MKGELNDDATTTDLSIVSSPVYILRPRLTRATPLIMSPASHLVGFCFPQPPSHTPRGIDRDLFPDDNYNQNQDRDGGSSRTDGRPKLHQSGSFSHRFTRPEQDDLSKGVLKLTLGNAVRHYLADWVLAALLWYVMLSCPGLLSGCIVHSTADTICMHADEKGIFGNHESLAGP